MNHLDNASNDDIDAIVEKFKNILERDDTFTKPRELKKHLEERKGVIPASLKQILDGKIKDRVEELYLLKKKIYNTYASNNQTIDVKIDGKDRLYVDIKNSLHL